MQVSRRTFLSFFLSLLLRQLLLFSISLCFNPANICVFRFDSSLGPLPPVSGVTPEEPVVCARSGLLFEKRLIEKHISARRKAHAFLSFPFRNDISVVDLLFTVKFLIMLVVFFCRNMVLVRSLRKAFLWKILFLSRLTR